MSLGRVLAQQEAAILDAQIGQLAECKFLAEQDVVDLAAKCKVRSWHGDKGCKGLYNPCNRALRKPHGSCSRVVLQDVVHGLLLTTSVAVARLTQKWPCALFACVMHGAIWQVASSANQTQQISKYGRRQLCPVCMHHAWSNLADGLINRPSLQVLASGSSASSLTPLNPCPQELLQMEPNVTHVKAPVVVVGDTHGQFHDLLEIFKIAGVCGGFAPLHVCSSLHQQHTRLQVVKHSSQPACKL